MIQSVFDEMMVTCQQSLKTDVYQKSIIHEHHETAIFHLKLLKKDLNILLSLNETSFWESGLTHFIELWGPDEKGREQIEKQIDEENEENMANKAMLEKQNDLEEDQAKVRKLAKMNCDDEQMRHQLLSSIFLGSDGCPEKPPLR